MSPDRAQSSPEQAEADAEGPHGVSIHGLFEERARQVPSAIALAFDGVLLSYQELDARASLLARRLRALDVGRGCPVGVLLESSAEMITAWLGVLKAGGAYVPLDPAYPEQRLAYMLADCRAPVLLTSQDRRSPVPGYGGGVLHVEDASGGDESRESETPLASVSESVSSLDPAYVIYTSGSTGAPKGVEVPHRAVTQLVCNTDYVSLNETDRVVQAASPSFDAATFEVWGALLNGARIVGVNRDAVLNPTAFAKRLHDSGATTLFLTTALFNRIAREQPGCLQPLRTVLFGGEVVDPDCVRRVLAAGRPERLLHVYGPTETTTFATWHEVQQVADDAESLPIGRPIRNTRLYVLDESRQAVAEGDSGELYIGGDGLATGYRSQPELTEKKFVMHGTDRVYRTGDRVRALPGGELEFLGRLDQQVKIQGFRVEPGEIERALSRHPDVREAVVVADREKADSRRLVAYVVGVHGLPPSSSTLRRFLQAQLPSYMLPSLTVPLPSLPLGPGGKVDRSALPPPPPERPRLDVPYEAPRTPIEEILAGIWSEVLEIDPVGIHDGFFELGGQSLMAMGIISRVQAALGVALSPERLFDGSTVGLLAESIEEMGTAVLHGEPSPVRPLPPDAELPLSFSQERVWFVQQLRPETLAYHFQAAIHFRGPLEPARLERALGEIVRRHEIYRTTFPERGGRPIQRIHSFEAPELEVRNLSHIPANGRAAIVAAQVQIESRRPFDLEALPLVRWRLLQLAPEEHVLIHVDHHLVHDGWSFNVFVQELLEIYGTLSDDPASQEPLAELPIQFANWASWQREWLRGETEDEQRRYWQAQLEGGPPALELPSARPHPPLPSFRGGSVEASLSADLSRSLSALSRREGTTLFMTMLAGFAALLHRQSEQDDFCIGTGVANRRLPESEGLIGMTINTLALRMDLRGNPTLRELLARVRTTCLGAYAHQDLPFERVVEAVGPERDIARNPLFQVMFGFHDAPAPRARLTDVAVDLQLGINNGSAKFDLNLTVLPDSALHLGGPAEGADGMTLIWEYASDLFDAPTIERMARHYERVLEGIANDADQRVRDLPLLSESERRHLLARWTDSVTAYPRDESVHRLFEAQAQRTPDAVAASYGEQQLRYTELDARANQLAHRLRKLGVRSEVRVGVCVERSVELVVALLGVLKAGGAYVPLDPSHPRGRLAFMLEDAGASVLLARGDLVDRLPTRDMAVLRIDSDWPAISGESDASLSNEASPHGLAYVMYTSGSSGRPKGVAVPHRAIVRLVRNTHYLALDGSSRIAQVSNFSFDAATFEIWGALLNGAEIVGIPSDLLLAPKEFADALREKRVTTLFLTTALFRQVVREVPGAFGSLDLLMVGGEAVDVESVDRVLKSDRPRQLFDVYGPTENTTFTTAHPISSLPPSTSSIAIGRPISNTYVHVLDAAGQPVPEGVPGELYIGGDGLARGYLNRPGATAERFVPDPFPDFGAGPGSRLYRTGDRVRAQADGSIEFMGRLDDQVKLRGFRIELGEVEAVLARHPQVSACAAVVRTEQSGERILVAYVTNADGYRLSASELRRHLKEALPPYMIPAAFVELDALPLTPNGKLDRRALPAPAATRQVDQAYVKPRGQLEAQIAAIWREVLELDRIGVDDNFFDLGGHSLRLLQVRSALEGLLGSRVPVATLFAYPSIAALARHLDGPLPQSDLLEEARERAGGGSQKHRRDGIAIVGMAGRFPGARDVDELWTNLRAGVESIRFFSEAELREAGLGEDVLADASYVPARGVLADVELFDASFFGFTPREAEQTDPQQRVFLECAWQALESAGYDPHRTPGLVGVYAGASPSRYPASPTDTAEPDLTSMIASNRDFLPTRVAYKLDLHGPAVNVQTACSTSLVAVHQACRALLDHDCDIALAGGVSISGTRVGGYRHQTSDIRSPDGHCRAFDASAAGTVPGEGVGIVVLKRLEDADSDGDVVHAVIRGTAVNNDGAAKVGFTAPSVEWQAKAIALAQARAGVGPDSIGYVESHGTGTALGDPVEAAALARVFGSPDQRRAPCVLGALKTNIGHLDAAAGIAGLIKTVMALKHRELPPTLHFREPNPEADLRAHGFSIHSELVPWETRNGEPRRAGVSAFGIGGTNAHAVVEEAATRPPSAPSRDVQLLVLSARTPTALDTMSGRLADYLDTHPDVALADVAYTLESGRHRFDHRRAVVCQEPAEAAAALRGAEPTGSGYLGQDPGVAFMFPGQGAQHVNMGRDLYFGEPVFRTWLDRCSDLLEPRLGVDLRRVLYPPERHAADCAEKLAHTSLTQPALFAVEYALAQLWMDWGVRPVAMIGHSVGEFVATCLAGVMTLEDALVAVAERGRLMGALPSGAMLAVPLAETELEPLLNDRLAVASVNGPTTCVVSGLPDAIDDLARRLASNGLESSRLKTSHGFHSSLMDPVLDPFAAQMAELDLNAPELPLVSNVTGEWMTAAQARDPAYYAEHLRRTVRFSRGLDTLAEGPAEVLLEVGPGRTLSTLAGRLRAGSAGIPAIPCLAPRSTRAGSRPRSDGRSVLEALGRLWAFGVEPLWSAVNEKGAGRRVELPTYPFERERYWLAPAQPSHPPETVSDSRPAKRESPDTGQERSVAQDETQDIVVGIWQDVLGIEAIDVRDDFFSLGGHSLLAIQLAARLRDAFGVELPLRAVFEAHTVELQARLLAGVGAASPEQLDVLLSELENLSPEELRRQLEAEEPLHEDEPADEPR